jgi:hypothetical protein
MNGQVKSIPKDFPMKIEPGNKGGDSANTAEYLICRTSDGTYYGVYEPVDDYSMQRIQRLRDAISEAASRFEQ